VGDDPSPEVVAAALAAIESGAYKGPPEAFARLGPSAAPLFTRLRDTHWAAPSTLALLGFLDPLIDLVLASPKAKRERILARFTSAPMITEAVEARLRTLLAQRKKDTRERAVDILEALPASDTRRALAREAAAVETTGLADRLRRLADHETAFDSK
jgi:hypothetical protein